MGAERGVCQRFGCACVLFGRVCVCACLFGDCVEEVAAEVVEADADACARGGQTRTREGGDATAAARQQGVRASGLRRCLQLRAAKPLPTHALHAHARRHGTCARASCARTRAAEREQHDAAEAQPRLLLLLRVCPIRLRHLAARRTHHSDGTTTHTRSSSARGTRQCDSWRPRSWRRLQPLQLSLAENEKMSVHARVRAAGGGRAP
jgi:hypothetical protein